jgi:hypothetical protein
VRRKRVAPRSIVKRVGKLGRVGPVSLEATAIDEECGRANHTTSHARVDVALNSMAQCGGGQVVGDADRIHADGCGVLDEIVVLQRILILVQKSMHSPKRVLTAAAGNGFGCLRGGKAVRKSFNNRKMSEDEPHVIANIFEDLLQDQVGVPTLRVLVATILDQRDRRISSPAHVIVGANG